MAYRPPRVRDLKPCFSHCGDSGGSVFSGSETLVFTAANKVPKRTQSGGNETCWRQPAQPRDGVYAFAARIIFLRSESVSESLRSRTACLSWYCPAKQLSYNAWTSDLRELERMLAKACYREAFRAHCIPPDAKAQRFLARMNDGRGEIVSVILSACPCVCVCDAVFVWVLESSRWSL